MTDHLSHVRGVPAIFVATLVLAACSDRASPPQPQVPSGAAVNAAGQEPADAHLAALYRQSCQPCHAIAAGGAPLTGDRFSWDPRWEKGMETLRTSTITGLNGMPAGGQCFACTVPDYEALITFMAGREPVKN